MKRKDEQRVWAAMRKAAVGEDLNFERVENVVAEGMPDLYCKTYSTQCWVELKAARLPARATTRVLGNNGLSQQQINWHTRHSHYGLTSYILIRDNKKSLYLISNRQAEILNEMNAADLRKFSLADSWSTIFAILRHPK